MTIGKSRSAHALLMMALALGGVILMASAPEGGRKQSFSVAELFFELNDTDGDLGIHSSIDGDPWTDLEIEDPSGHRLLSIVSNGRLRDQGLTQVSFESAEPSFDELDPADFFARFPAGRYEIEGLALGGGSLASAAVLSQVLAAPPQNIVASGVPVAPCDAAIVPFVSPPVVVRWDPVTGSHPEIGTAGAIKVALYQLFIEGTGVKFSVDLPPTVTEFEVPTGVTALDKRFKLEIIVRTTAGNNTAVESCFQLY